MSVRVVRDVPCPMCQGHMRVRGAGQNMKPAPPETWMLRDHQVCPVCHGTGTITEPVTCAGCKFWVPREAYGKCKYLGCSWDEESPNAHGLSFACAAWEPKE